MQMLEHRIATTRYVLANMAWQLGGDARLIRTLAQVADVLLLVECRDRDNQAVVVSDYLDQADWIVLQDTSSAEDAGNAVAIRRGAGVNRRWTRSLVASLPGRDVQTRRLRVVHLNDNGTATRLGLVHIPLLATGRKDDAVRTCRNWWRRVSSVKRRALLGDFNMGHRDMRENLGAARATSFGRDVMGAVLAGEWRGAWVQWLTLQGTDHAVMVLHAPHR